MRIGTNVYGLAALALGLIGLVWGDFALVWQPVPANIPDRTALAYAVAAILVVAGMAVNQRQLAAYGAATLTILYGLGVTCCMSRSWPATRSISAPGAVSPSILPWSRAA